MNDRCMVSGLMHEDPTLKSKRPFGIPYPRALEADCGFLSFL